LALLEYWLVAVMVAGTFFLTMEWLKRRLRLMALNTQNQPFLSLVLLTYNDEKIIEGSIRRLAKLPYFQKDGSLNYELVAVDGGSTDQTLDILERLTRIYPVLKISQVKVGELPEKQVLQLAKGEKICLLDRYSFLENNLLKIISNRLTEERLLDMRKSRRKRWVSKYGMPC